MIIDIVPIKRLPRGLSDAFSYNISSDIEKDIQPGQIVQIDFRNCLINGLIKAVRKTGSQVGLKTVSKIISSQPLITPNQIKLAKWLRDYYFISLSTAVKLIIPELLKKNTNYKLQITNNSQKINHKFKTELIWWGNNNEKNKRLIRFVKNAIKKNQQVLWLFPEQYKAFNSFQQCSSITPKQNKIALGQLIKQCLLWQNYSSNQKQLKQWLKIMSGDIKLIIGTRSALFAPFADLELIILEDEQDDLYKSQQTPRYHTREVVYELARLHKAKLVLTTPAPSLEAYSQLKNIKTEKLKNRKEDNVKIIDIKEERLKGNYSSLSEELQDAIKIAINNKKQVFLFLNRKGHSTNITCKDCGYSLLCPNCRLPLTFHAENRLICHHCRYHDILPPLCSKCQGPNIKLSGRGTQKLVSEIKKIYPKSSIIRIDSNIIETRFTPDVRGKQKQETRTQKNINYQLLITKQLKKADIIIGTEFAFSKLNWNNIGVIGVINADTALYRPDFRASERTYQLLIRLNSLLSHSELDSESKKIPKQVQDDMRKFIIQTYNPNNHVIQAIAKNNPKLFYEQELKLRKALSYPPYYTVLKLIYRNVNEKKAVGEAMHIYNRLKKHLKSHSGVPMSIGTIESQRSYRPSGSRMTNGLEILKPFPAFERKERGKFKFHLIVRFANNAPEKIYKSSSLQRTDKVLDKKISELLPADWVIDRDPETLL